MALRFKPALMMNFFTYTVAHYNAHISTSARRAIGILVALIFCLVLLPPAANSTSLLYKSYIVRYDRGWDILCEPYVVKKDDWVLKIFRQKGEIAHSDFRDFLGIFERLNPHIKNINMVRPGQTIDIPLRKLEHGTLPGQATGIVTIPFVTLSQVTDIIHQHAKQYRVKRGDTVSELIAKHYGRFGTKSYKEGIKLFQAANPEVTDLDRIYAGQKLYLPETSIRDQKWYSSLYDAQGNLKKTIDSPAAQRPQTTADTIPPAATTTAIEKKPENQPGPLAQAADYVGGKLYNKGTYYFPQQDSQDFELDLSRHPMMDLHNENKIVFTQQNDVMGVPANTVRTYLQNVNIIQYNEQSTVEEIVASIFETMESESKDAQVGFNDQGVQVAVTAKWIKPESDQRHLCISPINAPDEQTPEPMRRYLEQNGIILKEILPGGHATTAQNKKNQRHAVKNILALTPTSQEDFVRQITRTLELSYSPNVNITFPYAGIQVKAFSNLISTPNGEQLLVDFGDLYGDALDAIRNTGLEIVRITAENDYMTIVQKLFSTMALDYTQNPTFLAARRAARYNTTITIAGGILYAKSEDHHILLSNTELHPAITDLLSAAQIDVVTW